MLWTRASDFFDSEQLADLFSASNSLAAADCVAWSASSLAGRPSAACFLAPRTADPRRTDRRSMYRIGVAGAGTAAGKQRLPHLVDFRVPVPVEQPAVADATVAIVAPATRRHRPVLVLPRRVSAGVWCEALRRARAFPNVRGDDVGDQEVNASPATTPAKVERSSSTARA